MESRSAVSTVIDTVMESTNAISTAFKSTTGASPENGKLLDASLKAVTETDSDAYSDIVSDYTDIYLDIISSKKRKYTVQSSFGKRRQLY